MITAMIILLVLAILVLVIAGVRRGGRSDQ
jgi:hypothetical protein